jgi:hypothetical protein
MFFRLDVAPTIILTTGLNGKVLFAIHAEILFTNFLIEHNVPIAVSDHAGPLFRKMFPDSEIAKKYGCARTKTTAIIGNLAKDTTSSIADQMINNLSMKCHISQIPCSSN